MTPRVDIEIVDTPAGFVEMRDLFHRVWGGPVPLVAIEMLAAISHSGGYLARARVDGETVGASLGLLARYRGAPALHSHVTGLLPAARGLGLGRAMKLHQYRWASDRELAWIEWTFDPLVRRNAWFNIAVLGAETHAYLPSFYGEMTDAINAGDESDRLLTAWRIDPDRDPADQPLRDGSGVEAIDLVGTPADVVALRRDDPGSVAQWRRRTREALTDHLAADRRIIGFTRDGSYVIGSGP
jgi:predicted GNAT superfamily acetyltransferase